MQTIVFDDFMIYEGRCEPGEEPTDTEEVPVLPVWDTLRSDLDMATTLKTNIEFGSAFTGGGCGEIQVENTGNEECDGFELEVNVRPSWGELMEKEGVPSLNALELLENDAASGESVLKSHA